LKKQTDKQTQKAVSGQKSLIHDITKKKKAIFEMPLVKTQIIRAALNPASKLRPLSRHTIYKSCFYNNCRNSRALID